MGRLRTHGNEKHYGFRLPQEHYELLEQVAETLGLDVAAVMNLIVSEAIPWLRQKMADHQQEKAKLWAALNPEPAKSRRKRNQ